MVWFVLDHAQDIDQPDTKHVTFGCSGEDVWAEIVKKEKVKTGPLGKLRTE